MEAITNFENRVHRLWWVPLITGLIGIGLGIWCFLSPTTSLPVFAYAFAGILCFAGLLYLLYAFNNMRLRTNWGWSLAMGLIDLVCGIWLFTLPAAVLVTVFVYAIAIWILIVAINSICEATVMSGGNAFWTVWMVIMLIATIFFAIYFLSSPLLGGVAGWLWLGFSFIFYGAYRIALAFKIKNFRFN